MLHRLLFIGLLSLFTGYSLVSAAPSGWHVGMRSDFSESEIANAYLAALRILDRQEATVETSSQGIFNLYLSSAWASEQSCLLAGWEGESSASGRCLPRQNGFEVAKAKCGADEGQNQQIPCNPSIFGADLGCVKIEKSNSHWTRACTEALMKHAGAQSANTSLSSHSPELEAYLALHPELAKNAANAASKICSKVAGRKSDQGDCELLEKFLHAKAPHAHASAVAQACNDGSSVLGKEAAACVTSAKSAIDASESAKKWADCKDSSCRSKLLEAEIKAGLKVTLDQLLAAQDKTGAEFAYPLSSGNCELTVGYKMLKPYDASVDSVKASKMKPVKTLVLKIQNEDHYHAYLDRDHDLRKNLRKFSEGSDANSLFHGSVLQSALESCFEAR